MLIGFWLVAGGALPRPNVILTDLSVSLVLLGGFRLLLRMWRERTESELPLTASLPVRVGIIGASSLGAQLAQCLLTQKHLGRVPVAFFDDDFVKWQKHVHQVPVVGMPECLLQGWTDKLDEVAIALPNASPARLQQIYQFLSGTGLKIYSLEWPWPARTDQKQQEGQ
jgi:FlaA1/EpsC-like NDP-sugar epimerase